MSKRLRDEKAELHREGLPASAMALALISFPLIFVLLGVVYSGNVLHELES